MPASDPLERNRYAKETGDFPGIFRSGDIHFKVSRARYPHLIRSFNHPLRLIRRDQRSHRTSLYHGWILDSQSARNLAGYHSSEFTWIPKSFDLVAFEFIERIESVYTRRFVSLSRSFELQKFYVETVETARETRYLALDNSPPRKWIS